MTRSAGDLAIQNQCAIGKGSIDKNSILDEACDREIITSISIEIGNDDALWPSVSSRRIVPAVYVVPLP